ncbi:MAG: HAD family hydrolase [Anaerolineae bacterium]|jgi:phosphoglycolate phosphatase-like HAD superfamily hydrolase|nr:HAD family hydrolase [Anaerolineae bacterium]
MAARPIPYAKIRAWLFDLDGTLMDTDDQAVEALAHRLRLLGHVAAHDLARRLVMISESPLNHVLTLVDVLGMDTLAFTLRRRLSRGIKPTFRLITGVELLLEHLACQGNLAVVSTRSAPDAEAFLGQHGLSPLFALCVTQETTRRLKPHPQPVAHAAKTLGLAPSDCVMVGDTPADMRSARRAGAWAIGVLCGFGEAAELWRAGADQVVASTGDVLSLVTSEVGA